MPAATGNCLDEIEYRCERLESYSGLYRAYARVYYPNDEDQLSCVFEFAQKTKRKVTLRGGGHAFDEQSLGNDIIVSMEKFNSIKVIAGSNRVCVGAGATWGAILSELKRHGLVPFGTVTASHATAGGTVAADCLSRFSPRFGKEAKSVTALRLMTIDHGVIKCTRPLAGPPWTLEEQAFMAAVGGFGYLGALLDVTYDVRPFKRPAVLTQVRTHRSFANLAGDLIPATAKARASAPGHGGILWEAISAGLYPAGGDKPSSMLFSSKLTTSCKRRPFLLHYPHNPLVILAEWLMRVPILHEVLSRWFFERTPDGATYIDGLRGYLFFMDANALAKRIARRFGFDLKTVQQTFVVPADPCQDAPKAQQVLVDWLDRAHKLFGARKLTPTISDVLYLPEDMAFCLSPNAKRAGFAVSYAFETSNAGTIASVQRAFADLADVLWHDFDGRVSLVKNVHVYRDTLRAMYGADAAEFLQLKTQLDSTGVLRNGFFDRVLG